MKKIFKIKGMHCSSCSKLIESELNDRGVSSNIDSISGKAIIEFQPSNISEDEIKNLIKNLGYGIE